MSSGKLIKLIVSIGICQIAGAIGGLLTGTSVKTWYPGIAKPGFTPPGWVFGPVWITLYLMMGIALYLIWNTPVEKFPGKIKPAIVLFAVQLVLNVLWSFCFFYLRSPLYGMIEIILLLGAIVWTTWLFFRINPVAGYLMVPYIAWVSFAAFLNYSIWKLNS